MNGPALDVREELGRLRERQGGQTLREAKPLAVAGDASATATSSDRSCLTTQALNLSGRTIPPGRWGYVEDDLSQTDRTADYCDGLGPRVVFSDSYHLGTTPVPYGGTISSGTQVNGVPFMTNFPIKGGWQPNDYVLIFQYNYQGSPQGNPLYNGSFEIPEITQTIDEDGSAHEEEIDLDGVNGCFFDQLTDASPIQITSIGSASAGIAVIVWMVIRGVKRHDRTPINSGDVGANVSCIQAGSTAWTFDNRSSNSLAFPAGPSSSYPNADIAIPPTGEYLVVSNMTAGTTNSSLSASTLSTNDNNLFREKIDGSFSGNGTRYIVTAGHAELAPTGGPFGLVFSPVDTPYTAAATGIRSCMALALEVEPAGFPPPTCNPLLLTDLPNTAALSEETGAAKQAARRSLDKQRLRYPVIAKESIGNGGVGQVIWNGYSEGWGYITDPDHRWLGPPYENATRTAADKLGRYFKRTQESPIDALAGYFAGDPRVLFSTNRPTGVEILTRGRDVLDSAAIEVTVEIRRTSQSGSVISARWKNLALDTGYDEALVEADHLAVVRPSSVTSAGDVVLTRYTSDTQILDLARDSLPEIPVYGPAGRATEILSDNERFRALLFKRRHLIIEPVYDELDAIADDAVLTDTFTIAAETGLITPATCHPWRYVDPANGTAGTFASWPETIPDIGSPVPVGSTTISVEPAYDPWLQREPTDGDEWFGLQWCGVRIHGRNLGNLTGRQVVACPC